MSAIQSDGVVTDANIISLFIQDHKNQGPIFKLISFIADTYGLAINTIIEQEWKNTTGNEIFDIWITDCIITQKIRFVEVSRKLTKGEKNVIYIDYGFPQGQSRDIEYIKCAINTEIKYILTNDMDFFDPKKKEVGPRERDKIMIERRGKFCRFLRREYGIRVGLAQHCSEDLKIDVTSI